jgi:hypothetical protein
VAPIFRESTVRICQCDATLDYLLAMVLLRIRTRLFHDTQYFQ